MKKSNTFSFATVLCLIAALSMSLGFLPIQKSNSTVVSFMPDFYMYWEKVKGESLETKISLWDTLFESKHKDFYDNVIYRMSGQDPAQIKPRLIKGFLSSLEDSDVQRMKESEEKVKELIPLALNDLLIILPEEKKSTTHFILPALNLTSGAVRPYKGDMVVYYGLETLSKFKNSADRKAIIAHETFHVHHFRHLFPYYREKYGEDVSLMSALQGEGLLFFSFMEGLAVFVTEKLYPDVFRPGLVEKNVPLYMKNFIAYTREFLKDMQNFSYQVYQKYFTDYFEDPVIPAKFGYWLGYSIVKSLVEEYSIQEMMSWLPENAINKMKEEIDKILESF